MTGVLWYGRGGEARKVRKWREKRTGGLGRGWRVGRVLYEFCAVAMMEGRIDKDGMELCAPGFS
jgi:hypothetical protein